MNLEMDIICNLNVKIKKTENLTLHITWLEFGSNDVKDVELGSKIQKII